jgi:hypothetical protein
MSQPNTTNAGSRAVRQVASIGSRAASVTLRPVGDAAAAAVGATIKLERRAVDRVLDGPELERLQLAVIDSPRLQNTIRQLLASDGAKQIVASVFDSGLFDEIADRLLASPALWRLIDEIADSPAVTAAITQQGFGFADQVGAEVRSRSRNADDWLERAARRLVRRPLRAVPPAGEEPPPEVP